LEGSCPANAKTAKFRATLENTLAKLPKEQNAWATAGATPAESFLWFRRNANYLLADKITGQDSLHNPLPRLLELLAREVPAIRRLRFTSGHPLGVTPELVRAMREIPAVCAHLHLPMQSGSDRVLKEMRRGYDRARYLEAVRALREGVPDIAITTDVIVGFPGETEEDFELTRSAMEEAAFDNAFVFKYSPRPGTPSAERPDDVPDEEKRRRDQVLLADQDARGQRLNDRWTGRTVEVLADGPSLRNAARWSGRTEQNKIVVFEPVPGLARGDFVQVRIESAHPQTLFGTVAH
jgi:tRNA-2-methylthio-N6-dimethylallyladenosine synthase